MRRYIVVTSLLAFVVALVLLNQYSHQRTRYGFTLTRINDETIRLSWGTPSGVNISPESTMMFFLGHSLASGFTDVFPPLSNQKDVWMYEVDLEHMGSAVPASYVNPLNDGAFNQMFEMIRLGRGGNANAAVATRMAACNYTYLGWVVMNDDDVLSLKSALADRSHALDQKIETSSGPLYRIEAGVETHFAANPSDQTELAALRAKIPVMFEVLDSNAGHPCQAMHVLFLDGHVERIPVGDRFPATQTFINSFPSPRLTFRTGAEGAL
jgi:prepilin-type processing-associated H-X9-DG protein